MVPEIECQADHCTRLPPPLCGRIGVQHESPMPVSSHHTDKLRRPPPLKVKATLPERCSLPCSEAGLKISQLLLRRSHERSLCWCRRPAQTSSTQSRSQRVRSIAMGGIRRVSPAAWTSPIGTGVKTQKTSLWSLTSSPSQSMGPSRQQEPDAARRTDPKLQDRLPRHSDL